MTDDTMTREDLLSELLMLRGRVAELEAREPSPDTSGEKAREQALRESEEKYREVVQKAHEGILVAQEGMLRFVNPALARIWGYDEEELVSRPFIEFIHPDDSEMVLDRSLRRAKGEKPPGRYAFRIVTKDGTTKWVEIDTAMISWEGKGAALTFMIDVTERKQMEEAIRERDEQYRALVEESFDGIMITKETKILFVNSRLCQMLGYSREELEGMDFLEPAHPDFRDVARERALARMRGESVSSHYELKFQRKDGSAFDGEIHARAIETRGAPGVQVWIRDITERKKTGEALQRAHDELERRVQERTSELRETNKQLREQIAEREQAEEALRESEKRYRELVENANDLIFQSDSRGIATLVNPLALKITGYSKEEFIGKHYLEFIHPEYRAAAERFYGIQFVKKIRTTYYEVPILTKHQETVWFGQNVQLLIKGDAVVGFQAIARDITERKRAEDERERTLSLLRATLESTADGILAVDTDGKIASYNKEFLTMWSIPNHVVESGSDLEALSFVRDQLKFPEDLLKKVSNLYANPDAESFDVLEFNDGRIFERYSRPQRIREKIVGRVWSFRDITKRSQAEGALRESEEKYRSLFEESIDAVYITTREGSLVDANQAFLDLFGFSREEARNMEIQQIYTDAAGRKRFQEEIERKGSLKDYEVSFRKKDGTKIEGLLTSTVRRDHDGTILGYQGIIRDVTTQNQLQRQLLQAQKMEAIGTLAGGIAHDFNNLLQAILGYSDLLLMKKASGDPDRKKLEVIQHAVRDGADLVSRILTFSRKGESRKRPIDLNEEIRRVEKLLRRTLPRMIQVDLVLGEDLRIIDADPAQIEQVLLNLGVNAQHAMPDGGRLVIETNNVSLSDEYVRTHIEARPGKCVLMTVSDNGIGMEPDVLDHIFEPFFTTRTNGEGTGLGLAMVHGVVSQHGGYIRCYSEPGMGTSFKIYFPVSPSELISGLTMTREMPTFGTETILLVDDDDYVRDIGRQLIEMGGYKVLIARSGEEALEMYTSYRPEISLIILDLIMPGMGGTRCLEELLRIDPDVRVLVASGYSSNGLTTDQKGRGARGFVSKPYDAKDILIAIRRVLDKGHL